MLLGKRADEDGEARIPLLREKHSFDELTRGVASGTISRSRALKLVGAAILGSALIPFVAAPAEAKKKICKNSNNQQNFCAKCCGGETGISCKKPGFCRCPPGRVCVKATFGGCPPDTSCKPK